MSTIASLHLLPAELWLYCWSYCSHRQFRRLTLVCKTFRALCLPFLLETQFFDIRAAAGNNSDCTELRVRRVHRTAVRLDRLAEGPLALMVRSWTFIGSGRGPTRAPNFYPQIFQMPLFDSLYKRALATFCSNIGRYQQLRCLFLQQFTVDSAFRDILSSLSLLADLTLSQCDIVAREGGHLNLRALKVTAAGLADKEPLRLASPDHLRTLEINASREDASILTGFGPAQLPCLVSLSLGSLRVTAVSLFFSFLKQFNVLEELTIWNVFANTAAQLPVSLDSEITPRLHRLTGPPCIISLFTENRPINAVTVIHTSFKPMSMQDLTRVLLMISRTSTALRRLGLPSSKPTSDLITQITSLFPHLRELSLKIAWEEADDSDLFDVRFEARRPAVSFDDVPALCDETAFDDIPTDDVNSDVEETEPIPVLVDASVQVDIDISASPTFQNVVSSLCNRSLSLPAEIQVLRLPVWGSESQISTAHQHQVIANLSALYPGLREVQLGFSGNHWERKGMLWKRPDGGACMRIQMRV
ncbi:hypothetical protein B0H13DRAFT_2680821 [Mycena leptocephala]|nr:hypothetical protein B0H13DRAFT_2680821 [Mycena leptocephala]